LSKSVGHIHARTQCCEKVDLAMNSDLALVASDSSGEVKHSKLQEPVSTVTISMLVENLNHLQK